MIPTFEIINNSKIESKMKILLFGATGMQGSAIAQKLIKNSFKVLSPVRSSEKVEMLAKIGVTGKVTDFSKDSLKSLVEQVDQVILLVPAVIPTDDMVPFVQNALEAIKEAGNKRTVFNISSVIPDTYIGIKGPDTRLKMKEIAFEILPEVTVTSTTLYLENFSTAYRQSILEQGSIPQAVPADVPIAYMSMDDLAAYLIAILKEESFKGKFLTIGGKEALDGNELATKLSEITGNTVNYFALQPEQLIAFLTPMFGQDLSAQVGEMYAWEGTTGKDKLNPDTSELQQKLGLNLPNFKEWASEAFKN